MRFPSPPPLKAKPKAPVLPPHLRPARPKRAMFVIGISVLLWMCITLALAALFVFLLRPLYSQFASPRIITGAVLLLALWIGYGVGWSMGNFILFEAMKTGETPDSKRL